MIKKINHLLLIILLTHCNNHPSTNQENAIDQKHNTPSTPGINDTLSTNTKNIFQEIEHDAVFTASGTEPGWIFILFPKKYKFITNYGADTIIEEHHLNVQQIPLHFQSSKLSFNIDKKNCIALSGDTLHYTVKIKNNNTELNGCGRFLK